MLHIYTDGACSGNGKENANGGFGVYMTNDKDNDFSELYSEYCENTTNNREELKSIYHAIKYIDKNKESAIIYSDSAYCINTITQWALGWKNRGWVKADKKTPENLDLIKPIFQLYQDNSFNIEFRKVKGHSGVEGNEIADALASNNQAKLSKLINK